MNPETLPKDDRIAAAAALVVDGPHDDKVKGIEFLGQLRARPDLLRLACESRSAKMRAAGATALGQLAEHTDRLTLEQLTSDANSYVRTAACQGLGLGNFSKSYLLLIAIAEDAAENSVVRSNAIIAAARIASSEICEIAGTMPTQTESQVLVIAHGLYCSHVLRFEGYTRTLGALGGKGATEKLEALAESALQTGLQDPRDAHHLLNALARQPLTERGQAIMAQALERLPGGRMDAARALALRPAEVAREGLERVLSDTNPKLVRQAVTALCALGIERSLAAVEPLLKLDDANAVEVIKSLKGQNSFDFCLEIATFGKVGQRVTAIKKLLKLDPDRALDAIEKLVDDPNPQVRYAALQLLIAHSTEASRWQAKAMEDTAPWVALLSMVQAPRDDSLNIVATT